MNDHSLRELDEGINAARQQVQLGNAIKRLEQSKDFQEVVLEGYFKEEAIRVVHARTDPSCQTEKQQESLIRQADAIAHFKDFLHTQLVLAANAVRVIEDGEELRTELYEEDLS